MEKEFKKTIGTIRLFGKLQSSDEHVGFSFALGNSDAVFEDEEKNKSEEVKQIENNE